MLCNVIHVVIFFSFGILHVTILLQCLVSVESALPPGVEDEIIFIEHLPGYRVHLQDFFWTGSENGPPWLSSEQKLTMYETKTIYHTSTVYLDDDDSSNETAVTNSQSVTQIPLCPSCIEPTPTLEEVDQNIGIFVGQDPGPRYWLLTVLRAGEEVPSNVELRLARLYRKAFNRQQQRHLGLSSDLYGRRMRQRRNLMRQLKTERRKRNKDTDDVEIVTSGKETNVTLPIKMELIDIPRDDINLIINPEGPETQIRPFEEEIDMALVTTVSTLLEESDNHSKQVTNGMNVTSQSKNSTKSPPVNPNLVQVSMQNTSITEVSGTRLIYSVHLGGKPVPAETAAKDMALLSPQEVALALGAPVIIQGQPYLRETRPLALSRKRDAWLLIGAAGAAVFMLAIVIVTLALVAKRKRAHSAVVPPPTQSILKKERDYSSATPGIDNTAYTSETEARTDGTSQRRTPHSYSRTPITLGTPDTIDDEIKDISSDEDEDIKKRSSTPWEIRHYPEIARNIRRKKMTRRKALDYPKTPDSTDSLRDQIHVLDSYEKGFRRKEEEAPESAHSYLSMPSCKQFPSMASVEPLSRVLEPVMVKHLDLDECDSPELKIRRRPDDYFLTRAASETQDPGVIGPIVWDLHKQKVIRGTKTPEADTGSQRIPFESVGRARRRLHELLEDSFSLFSNKEGKAQTSAKQASSSFSSEHLASHTDIKRKEFISPRLTPVSDKKLRPRTSLPNRLVEGTVRIEETGNVSIQPRGAWGARPMSAGPFHRPCLPENKSQSSNVSRFPTKDPAVPLIAAISKELEQFSID